MLHAWFIGETAVFACFVLFGGMRPFQSHSSFFSQKFPFLFYRPTCGGDDSRISGHSLDNLEILRQVPCSDGRLPSFMYSHEKHHLVQGNSLLVNQETLSSTAVAESKKLSKQFSTRKQEAKLEDKKRRNRCPHVSQTNRNYHSDQQ